MAIGDIVTPVKLAQVLAVGLIGVYTYRKDMLNATGAFTAFVMGSLIVFFTNFLWLLLLFALLGLGSAATRFRFKEKQAAKVSEKGKGGRRSTRNVIGNGLAPAVLAVIAPLTVDTFGVTPAAIAYISAIAVAASDTFASEFGSLSRNVYLITTFRKVPAGVDGGVSLPGQAAALAGGFLVAGLGALLLGPLTRMFPLEAFVPPLDVTAWVIALPALMGFLGCQIDSVLGATLEGEGLFTKEETNLLSIVAGGALGFVLAIVLGL